MDISKNIKIKKIITVFIILFFSIQLIQPLIISFADAGGDTRRTLREITENTDEEDRFDSIGQRHINRGGDDYVERYNSETGELEEEYTGNDYDNEDFILRILKSFVVWLLRFVLDLLIKLYGIVARNFFGVVGNVIYPEGTITLLGSIYVNVGGIIKASSLSLLVLMALWKGFNTYILWKDGNPEENPLEIITRYLFAVAMLFSFDELFSIASEFFMGLSNTVSLSTGSSFNTSQVNELAEVLLMIIIMISLIKEIMSAVIGLIGKGIELFIMRIGFPFACVSAVTPQAGGFHNYVSSIIKGLFTIVVMQTVIGISMQIFSGGNNLTSMIWSWATLQVATRGGSLISSLVSTGSSNAGSEIGGGAGGVMRGTMTAGRVVGKIGKSIGEFFK